MNILAIETSCDETAAAVVRDEHEALSNVVASQIDIHVLYGGVVPEIAARAHVQAVIPVIEESLLKSNLKWDNIDAIAVTQGPGLVGSLIVGTETARTLAILNKKPLIAVNHLEGHVYANWIGEKSKVKSQKSKKILNTEYTIPNTIGPTFPLIALLVSGGHTMLIYMPKHYKFEVIGSTRDDAAGEAFDKVAALLALPYPGGPSISKLAEKGDENRYKFPIVDLTPEPRRSSEGFLEYPEPSLNFSLSGLKTAVLNEVLSFRHSGQVQNLSESDKADIAASFQKTLVDTLAQNSQRAIEKYKPKSFILSGGVAANQKLREKLEKMCEELKVEFYMPNLEYCTDNAAMIGAAAYYKREYFGFTEPKLLTPNPNLKIK
jgi:N6-L-threonylcarbamoyladenine synthase